MFSSFLITLLISLCVHGQESIDILWQQYQTTIATLTNDQPQNLMLLGFEAKPYNFNLDEPNPVDIDLLNLVDVQPWNHNGPTEKFQQAYQDMFRDVDITADDLSRTGDIKKLHDENADLLKQITSIVTEGAVQYGLQCAALLLFDVECPPGPEYLEESGINKEMESLQLVIDANNREVDVLVPLGQGPLVSAASDANNTGKGTTIAMDFISGETVIAPNYRISPTPRQLMDNFDSIAMAGFTVNIDHSTSFYNFQEDKYSSDVKIPFLFFGSEASSDIDLESTAETDTNFKASITFTKWARVSVTADDWFHGDALTIVAEQPQIIGPNFSAFDASGGNAAFFGPQGLINSRVVGLIVALDISVQVTWSESNYNDIKQHVQEHSTFGIGPFRFSTDSSSHDSNVMHTDDDTKSLVGEIQTGVPVVIGYQTTRINEDLIPSNLASVGDSESSSSTTGYVTAIVVLVIVALAFGGLSAWFWTKLNKQKQNAGYNQLLKDGVPFTEMNNDDV